MTKKTFSTYVLDLHRIKRLPSLECDICKQKLQIGDTIVRKHRRIYHKRCYDISWIDVPDDVFSPEERFFIEHGYFPNEQMNTISPCSISMQTIIPTSS
jgi:hypothetical protein